MTRTLKDIHLKARTNSRVEVQISAENLAKLHALAPEYQQLAATGRAASDEGQRESQRLFTDPARVLWNAGVNTLEGLENTGLEVADPSLTVNPQTLTRARVGDVLDNQIPSWTARPRDHQLPRLDLSGAKPGYQSEMMQRDGLGEKIETGVTILGPLAVGGAMNATRGAGGAPETLQSLGALPEIEATPIIAIAKQGVVIEAEGAFGPKEKPLAEYLAKEGQTVEKLPENHSLPGRKADAKVGGVVTEFKKLDVGATNSTLKESINNSVRGGGQARNMIIDARGTGLSEEEARRGLARASGITRGRIDSVRVIGDGFDITAKNFK